MEIANDQALGLLQAVAEVVKAIVPSADKLAPIIDGRIAEALANLPAAKPTVVEFRFNGTKLGEVKGRKAPEFDSIARRTLAGVPVMLVGPAGCGKTHLCGQLAEALGLPFASITCNETLPLSRFVGRKSDDGQYQETDMIRMVREGGLFLVDEIDAADANTLLALNPLTAGLKDRWVETPAGIVKAHPDFRMIVAANTWGSGADRQYVGRNQLDAATLDRFSAGRFAMDYDAEFERDAAACVDGGLAFVEVCHAMRLAIRTNGLRRIMSTRFILNGLTCLAAGDTLADVMRSYLLDWTADEKRKLQMN